MGAAAGALTAIIGLWLLIGAPIPAFSSDLRKLDNQQVETAIDLYRKDVRDAILLRGAVKGDPTAERLIEENLQEARDKLKRAQDRKIELSR